MIRFLLGLSLISVLLSSCKGSTEQGGPFRELSVLKTSKSFMIPKDLNQKILKGYVDYIRSTDPSNIDTDEKIVEKIPREFLEIDVYFSQEQNGALESDFVMRSPRGGGLIDLSGQVPGQKGSFYVRFDVRDPSVDNGKVENLQVYYLSTVPKRTISGEIYGVGCGALIDISSAVLGSRNNRGIKTNATDDRYFNTVVGDYFFVSYRPEQILLAALHIDDSSVDWPRCAEDLK